MKLIFNLFFLFVLTNSSFGQLSVLRDNGSGNPIMTNPYREVKGSPYVADFKKGTIFLSTGQKIEGLQIALNGYENTLEYKLEGNLYAYTPEKLNGFSWVEDSGELVQFTSIYSIPTVEKKRFLKILEEGDYTLLAYPYKIMTDDVAATYGAQAAKVFQSQEDLFLVKEGQIFLFKNKTKDLAMIFGEDMNKVTEIQKSKKLNLKDTADIILLVRELNLTK